MLFVNFWHLNRKSGIFYGGILLFFFFFFKSCIDNDIIYDLSHTYLVSVVQNFPIPRDVSIASWIQDQNKTENNLLNIPFCAVLVFFCLFVFVFFLFLSEKMKDFFSPGFQISFYRLLEVKIETTRVGIRSKN